MADRNPIPMASQVIPLLIFFCAIIGAAHGEFVKDPTLCGRTKCRVPVERKFKYLEGTYYHYQYSVDVSTNLGGHIMPGYPTNESTLHIDGVATLHFTTPCEGHLRFSNVSISHDRERYNPEFPDRAGAEFKGTLERFSLRFAFDDGQVHEVCPNRRETVWALNLKKGVLSMLQNTMKRFDVDHRVDEMDVNGVCDTKYNLHEARRTSLIVRKTKNLAECTLGRKHLSIVQSTAYRSPRSKAFSQPLLRSTSECEITIDHNVYESVVCKDLHRLQPFSHGNEAGARTESTATLKLVEESRSGHGSEYDDGNTDETDDDDEEENKYIRKIGTKRTTLLYDHAKTSRTMHGELRTARDLLKNMCKLSANSDELQQRFSEMFTAFVHSARLLDYPSLSQLFARANGICRNGKKHIVKALPFLGTNPSVNVMKNLIMRKFVDKTTTDNWVTTFALIPRPDQDTVRVLAPLLDFQHEIPEAQFILSYSAVIHAYCANHRDDCARLNAVRQFLSYLEKNVEGGCTPRTHSLAIIKETLQALKAIGNMGLETQSLLQKLKTCIEDSGGFLPMEIRVAAIDAHRRLPSCEKTRDKFFLNYYRNFTLDSEIRIASYLQVMRCPDYNVIKTIKHTLKDEEVNQVGSFVWSHLTNLYASSSPTRVEIQSLLTDRDLGMKFNSDMRKFSRNYDGSFFSEEYNFGANYQSNLIFSPKSYIPRSVSFNMTMDVLGESVNVFEIAARMEGLEYYAESLFGPDGPYSGEKVSNHIHNFLRSFRSANENDDYWKRVKRLPNVIDNNFDHPRVSMSYKVFGNELKYIMLDGDQEIRTTLANLNPIEMIKQFLSGQEVYYENTVMFLDSTYVIPTSSGLPVRLDVSGSAACNFKLSGLLDSRKLYRGEFEFMGNITPSASIDVVGSMTVDAFYKSSGIKLRTNVYSSGGAQVELIVKGARQIRLSLSLPNKKMEVFSIATDVLLTTSNGAEIDEKAIGILIAGQNYKNPRHLLPPGTVVSNTTCSWAALDRLIGLKMCADYQFPNVTKNPNASYFVLNGPTLFKVSLNKADPTAKSYLLEYTWVRTENSSVIRMAFDTPGSQVNRELSATVAFETKSNNVTVTLQSSGNSLIAKGIYKRTDDETFIDVGFDVNGTKHLDLTLGYSREKFAYGYTYIPKMQLTIYNERVAKISGSIRNAHKMNMTQSDIDLTFQTKKVWSRLVGYIVKRNASLAGDFQLDYQLQRMPKKETLHLEISLANRSSRPITHKSAELKLHSTAYPQLNTVITAWYQQALGHLEVHAEVNSSPHLKDDRHKLTAQLIISYSKVHFQNQGTKVNILFAITKPIQNIDIKIGINHYAISTESKTSLLIGYAPGKEISLVVSVITPRGLLFSVEGHANLTIPNFNSMLLDVRINERSRREYELDFAGTWFSGHNITARGTYTDRSTPAVVSHNLKLILKSPSFSNDVLVNCKLYHDYNNLEVSIHVDEIDVDKYAFILNYTSLSGTRLITYVEGRYKNNVYSVLTSVDTEREIRIEMHLDKWRDVHLTLIGTNNPKKKEFGVELKWDANRDPALKFVTIFTFEKHELAALTDDRPAERNLTALLVLSYPGRLVTGKCLLGKRGDFNYRLDSSLEWNPEKMIRLAAEGDYNVQTWITSMKVEAELLTPFELWKKTALNAKYVQEQNTITATTSAYWRDSQHILVEFHGKESGHDDLTEWLADFGLRGTVHSIEWVTATVTHKVLKSQSADTQILIKYHPDKVIDARSIWQLDRESDDVFCVTGHIHLESPLASYRKSDMKCQLRVTPNWKFDGAANLELDKRKYTSTLVGDLWKFKESMIEFKVTTPLEKYAFIRGRFGLSETDRHIVAEVVTPTGPLGVEAYFQLFTAMYDFNVKLQIATPIEAIQKALLIAKLGKREADFRIANNDIVAGFQGVWHYNNLTDFDYTYILYTPLHGLHECGIITKLIVTRTEPDEYLDVDAEFSIRMVEVKVGIKMKGGPKPPPVRIPIKKDLMIVSANRSKEEDTSLQGDEEGEEEEDEEDCFYWRGELEVYLAVINAITAELDLDNEGSSYNIAYAMQIPHGKILLNDHFWMEDVFNMRNDLAIETPFDFANEITSLYVLSVDLEKHINMMRMDFNVRRNLTWFESGLSTNYTYHKSELDDSKTHMVKVNVKTPLVFLKYIDTRVIVDVDENFYKSNLAIRAENCTVDLIGSLELEDAFIDTIFSVKINSSALFIPKTKITAKKDFGDKEKQLKFSITVEEPVPKSTTFQATWQIQNQTYIKASLGLDTWIPPLKNLETNLLFVDSIAKNGTARLNANFKHNLDQEFKVSGVLRNGTIDAELYTPVMTKEHFEFHGNLIKLNGTLYRVHGDWKNIKSSETYGMITDITTQNDAVSTLETTITPKVGGSLADKIVIRVKKERYGLTVATESHSVNSTLNVNYINTMNWDIRLRASTLRQQGDVTKDQYELSTFMNVQVNGNATLYIHAETPWKNIETLTINGNMLLTNNSGNVGVNHRINDDHYHMTFQWKLIYFVDMFARIMGGYEIADLGTKDVNTLVFFKNPGRAFRSINTGFDVDIDHEEWKFATNATVGFRNFENFDAVLTVKLPPPNNDKHRVLISYHALQRIREMSYVAGYNALNAKTNYASDGSLHMLTNDINGHLRLTWGMLPTQSVNNLFNVTFDKKEVDLMYSVFTPKFLQEETLILLFNYDGTADTRSLLKADVFYPARQKVGTANISFVNLANVNGTVNASTTLPNFSYVGCNFIVATTLKQNKRFIEIFWPNNTALLNSEYTYHSEKLDSNLEGIVRLEVPLNTRHVGHLTYGYKKRPQVTTGYSVLDYNGQKILHGQYNSKSESRAGFEKDRIEITVENVYAPIGIIYINQYEYSAGNEGTNYPTIEFKQANIYRLDNSSLFNIIGESRIRTTHTGQEIHLKAIHSNRTVQLKTDYQVLPGEFDQNAWLSLAEDAWISYHINILNKTTEDVENQFIVVSVAYPRRNFTLDGSYRINSNELNSEAKLEWDQDKDEPRTLGAAFDWRNITSDQSIFQQQAALSLRHPSFVKEVTLKGEILRRDVRDLFNMAVTVDYSVDPDRLFILSALLRDESELPHHRRYIYNITGKHPRTKFNLDIGGFVHKYDRILVETENRGKYKRTFLPEESGQFNARMDAAKKEILFHRESNEVVKYFKIDYYPEHPKYVVNGSLINTPNLNATGEFYFNPDDKFTWMMVNYTPDAIESLRMYGNIPDARNAVFDIWRTYDQDLTVSDVSFYVKLNHSRLVTSTLRWRPELKTDVMDTIKNTVSEIYENVHKDADYWKQYVKSETISVITEVWDDAQDEMSEFLHDWNDLRNLEQDFKDLKIYLNNSYNANDFYIRDIVACGIYVIDELSLRSHIESLPNILNEVWEIMGESGEAIRQSLLWIIETIKKTYDKISEIITAVLRGDSISQVANIIERLIEKYDMFIKDLHVSFIKYIENLWNQISTSISQQWYKFLKIVEPLFIRMLHYLETVLWKASKEIVDFLYDRRNEIMTSPYFDRFTNFTQDIDKFYRDIKGNDIITNVQKYSGLVIQFLKDRYFAFVPFGKELKDVVDEIVSELKELRKLPSVHYALDKMQQVYDKANYLVEYFDVKAKIESLVRLIHSKLVDISQSALQAESRYREAKTKFIFDPYEGLMCLEQKLPMSWHAFNQTPEFQEIPEYRAIADLRSYFVASNTTFWTLYYQYKPYTEPSNWLPPFKAQAMTIGSQYFTTFDGRHFKFAGSCTYVLAHDFVRNTFTILVKYDRESDKMSHQIVILIGDKAIELDIFTDMIRLVSKSTPDTVTNLQLPVELDNSTYVYQEENVITVERKDKQFRLECNLKFDLCILELAGWYYGKTAGLLGTMNNEPMDDTVSSGGIVLTDIGEFAHSWTIDNDNCPESGNLAKTVKQVENSTVVQLCEELFLNKSSEFNSCFGVIDPNEYARMCLNSENEAQVCSVTMAYMQTCMFYDTYLRIPDKCTTCTMIDGTQIAEGEFKKLEGDSVPKSVDVVFIVEAKECNRDIKQNRSIEQLVTQLNKEFRDQGLVGNRWSLVAFGGDGVFNQPRSVILDGQIFTKNVVRFLEYFDHVPVGDGSQDVFAAIGFATQLVFRAGVSKTFVLMPCSHCEPENQTLDYYVVYQVLREHDIPLHILMDGEFQFEKERLNKIFYGLDATKSYTKKDTRTLSGDMDLRRQVKLSKSVLGYCTALSLETNGTIFSGNKLRFEKLASIKKFVSVFSKRVALTAQPNSCQHCECTADNDGTTQMECMPCVYPTPVTIDYESFNFNESLSALQPLDLDYGQLDLEDD